MQKFFSISMSLLVCIVLMMSCLFSINQIEQVVVTRFGKPVRVIDTPGLHFKIPVLEEITSFDKRMINVEISALEVTLGDKRRLVVDAFCRYIITDCLKFYQTVYNENGVSQKLTPVVLGSLRSIMGNLNISNLLSEERRSVMTKIKNEVNKAAKQFGVDIVDVRIRKTDLPAQNSEAISNRMISERQREAKELRAKGLEMAKIITSTADRENSIAIAQADKKAQILVGEGEAEANKIFVSAFAQDKEFFSLHQTLNAYKEALGEKTTTLVLSSENAFLRRFFGD